MSKKVYVVNSGSYSDYRVDAIFTTKKKADEFMRVIKDGDYNEVQVFALDKSTADLVKRGYKVFLIFMLRDETVESCRNLEWGRYNTIESFSIWRRTQAPAFAGKGIPDCLQCTLFAKTEKQAIKICNDKRAAMIAGGEW